MVKLSKTAKGRDPEKEKEEEKQEEGDFTQREEFISIESYLQTKSIPELFNRLMTQIIHSRPTDVKRFVVEQLAKSMTGTQQYFTSEEFETMFDSYDIASVGQLPYPVLIQALKAVGVSDPETALSTDFPEIQPSKYVKKPKFVQVLMEEFEKHGFSY